MRLGDTEIALHRNHPNTRSQRERAYDSRRRNDATSRPTHDALNTVINTVVTAEYKLPTAEVIRCLRFGARPRVR